MKTADAATIDGRLFEFVPANRGEIPPELCGKEIGHGITSPYCSIPCLRARQHIDRPVARINIFERAVIGFTTVHAMEFFAEGATDADKEEARQRVGRKLMEMRKNAEALFPPLPPVVTP